MKVCRHPENRRGSVLVVSLLLLLAGTVGMASMTALLSTRTRFVSDMEYGIQRRIALRNCRALVHHYFMRQGIGDADNGGTLSLGDWGTIDIPATGGSPLGSQQEFSLVNYLSPGLDRGFTEDVIATIRQDIPNDSSGDEFSTSYRLQLKSRSPLLGGTLLVLQKPMTTPPIGAETDLQGAIQVNGNSLLWDDEDLAGSELGSFFTRTYDHPGTILVNIKNLSATHFPPTNFPFYVRSTGYSDVGVNGAPVLDGRFNMMQLGSYPPASPDPNDAKKKNTLHYKMVMNSSPTQVDGTFDYIVGAVSGDELAGERRITIDLNNPAVSPVIVNDGVYHLHLLGLTDSVTADEKPPGFIIVRSAELKTVTLENDNFRRLVVAFEGDHGNIDVGVTSTTQWRALITATASPLTFQLGVGNSLAIQGGVRTDSRLNVSTGQLVLNRETNPETLELMDPREAWIEIYSGS